MSERRTFSRRARARATLALAIVAAAAPGTAFADDDSEGEDLPEPTLEELHELGEEPQPVPPAEAPPPVQPEPPPEPPLLVEPRPAPAPPLPAPPRPPAPPSNRPHRIDRALGADGSDDARGCRASATVGRPPSAAFAFLADGHSIGEWMTEPGGRGTRAHVEHLDGPRVGVGAHYRLTQRAGEGATTESEFTTVEYEPDRLVAFRFENFFDMVFTVEAGPGGSVVTLARRPVPRPRGLRGRIYARSAFTPERVLPEVERELAAVERAIGG